VRGGDLANPSGDTLLPVALYQSIAGSASAAAA
jgi:hypothetical protein